VITFEKLKNKMSHVSLRFYFMGAIFMLITTLVLVAFSYYTVAREDRQVLERELMNLAAYLETNLASTYEDIITEHAGQHLTPLEQVAIINRSLQPMVNRVSRAYPSYGIGFYDIRLDSVVAIGPSFDPSMLRSVPRSFPYFKSYETGKPETGFSRESVTWLGEPIIHVTHPIIRDGEIIGHTWANAPMSFVHASARRVSVPISLIGLGNLALLMLLAFMSFQHFSIALKHISSSLSQGAVDEGLMTTIPELQPLAQTIMAYQEELRMASAGQVAASVVHEIRNPFTSIKGFSQLMMRTVENPRHKYYLETMIREVDRVSEIITSFLEFARPSPPKSGYVCVKDLFDDIDTMIGGLCLKAGVRLTFAGNKDIVIWCDRNKIKQVLLNLTQNALQALEPRTEGEITLSSERVGDRAVVKVSDNGPGIPADKVKRIFDPFFTTKAVGTGLGLPISRQLVLQQDGTIAVETTIDVGTTFTINLPTTPPQ
jgi:signal transduction histidine kinase